MTPIDADEVDRSAPRRASHVGEGGCQEGAELLGVISPYRWSVLGTAGNARGKHTAQVSRVRQILEGLGLAVATPDEAREILELKGGDAMGSDPVGTVRWRVALGRLDTWHQLEGGDESDGCKEVDGAPVVSGGDAAEAFQATAEPPDLVACLGAGTIVGVRMLAGGLGGVTGSAPIALMASRNATAS